MTITRNSSEQHINDFINFGYEEEVLASLKISQGVLLQDYLWYVSGPKQVEQIIGILDAKQSKWDWSVSKKYNELKKSQIEFLISSISKSKDEAELHNFIKLLSEFNNYSMSYYADKTAFEAGSKTYLNYDKQVADALKSVSTSMMSSTDIKEYAQKALLQLSEKSADISATISTNSDAKNAVIRFINAGNETKDDVILNKFFDAIYAESISLDGKLSPQTLSVLFRDDVLAYMGQSSNLNLVTLGGITKDMIELEKANGDIAGFKNAKIEEFKEKYEEIKGVVKK